jgi:hypothetical protein
MLQQLDSWDWEEVFGFSNGGQGTFNSNIPTAICGSESAIDTTPFGREDVAEIIGMSEGENDGDNWLIAGRLNDGRFFMIEAGCDYTGWD